MQSNITGHTCNREINQSAPEILFPWTCCSTTSSHLSLVDSVFYTLRNPAMHICSSVPSLFLWPLSPSSSSRFPIHSLNLKSNIISAWKHFLVPPKAKFITQPFEMLYLVEVTTVIKFWYIYFVFLRFCTLLINFNKNES